MSDEGKWRCRKTQWVRAIFELYDPQNRLIASNAVRGSTDYDPPTDACFEEMFDHIVRAVNAMPKMTELVRDHITLLTLLRDDLEKRAPDESYKGENNPYEKNRIKAMAVLAEAEGREG